MESRNIIKHALREPKAATVTRRVFFALVLVCLALGAVCLGRDDSAAALPFDPVGTEEGAYAYVDIISVSDWVCGYDGGETFYAAEDADNYVYALALSPDVYEEMADYAAYWDRSGAQPAPRRLYGVVNAMSEELRDNYAAVYELSADDVYSYFGDRFIDTVASPAKDRATVFFICAASALVLWLVLAAAGFAARRSIERSVSELEASGELTEAANEFVFPARTELGRPPLSLTASYVFSRRSAAALRYDEIVWCYRREQRCCFIPTGTALIANTKKRANIVLLEASRRDRAGLTEQALKRICDHSPELMVGYSTENRQTYRLLCEAEKKRHAR